MIKIFNSIIRERGVILITFKKNCLKKDELLEIIELAPTKLSIYCAKGDLWGNDIKALNCSNIPLHK